MRGSDEDLARDPASFVRVGGGVLANGRDPYFAAWPDVVQLNAFSPDLRAAVTETLSAIAAQCDGVRCDMAMLMMNDTFERTWGERAGPRPEADYWPTVIPAVKSAHPEFVFMAEAYWDLEWALQQQGFDYCYDKRLYDRLVHDGAEAVHGHLNADLGVPAAARPLHREPRRASRGGDVLAREGTRRRRDHAEPDRRAARPRGAARGPHGPAAGLPRAPARRAARSRRCTTFYDQLLSRARRRRLPRRRVAARRATRLGRKRHVAEPGRLGLARRRVPQARGREPRRRARVRPRLAALGRLPRTGVAARRRRERRGLRAERRRPPRRALRRARSLVLAPLRRDPHSTLTED